MSENDNPEAKVWAKNALKGAGPRTASLQDPGPGRERHWDADKVAAGAKEPSDGLSSLSGRQPDKRHPGASQGSAKPKERKLSHDEMLVMANKAIAKVRGETAAIPLTGPAVKVLDRGSRDNGYTTSLQPASHEAYRQWAHRNVFSGDTGADYDYPGAFSAGYDRGHPGGHLPDEFKKPNHETFSTESRYAVGEDADKAGEWSYGPSGERFVPPKRHASASTPKSVQKAPDASNVYTVRKDAPAVLGIGKGPFIKGYEEHAYPLAELGEGVGESFAASHPELTSTIHKAMAGYVPKKQQEIDDQAKGFMRSHPAVYAQYNAWDSERKVQAIKDAERAHTQAQWEADQARARQNAGYFTDEEQWMQDKLRKGPQ